MPKLRILSLLPAATEIVYLLGLEKYLVGVSDDCDYPAEAKKLPRVTECLARDLTSWEIDKQVKQLGHMGMSISHLDQNLLKELKPNLILTQDLCKVCAVSYSEVKKAARVLDGDVKIISLEPESIDDILENILLVGEACDKNPAEGEARQRRHESCKIVSQLKNRLTKLNSLFKIHSSKRPKVLVIEWLDPLMVAGHWVPEMIERAGGKSVITKNGQKSIPITIDRIVKADPDIIIFAPCGFDISRILKEKNLIDDFLYKLHDRIKNTNLRSYLMDGNAYLTRPGPRIVDGIEILAEILYPEIFPKERKVPDWQHLILGI